MSFDQEAVIDLFDRVQSHAMTLGLFEQVNTHETKSKPGNGLYADIWVDSIIPSGRASGLAATSGVVGLKCRIYTSMLTQPADAIDPDMLTAVTTLMGEYSGDFELGGAEDVRSIDLLGMYGSSLSAQAGYVQIGSGGGSMKRVMTITIPVIINDLWQQVA